MKRNASFSSLKLKDTAYVYSATEYSINKFVFSASNIDQVQSHCKFDRKIQSWYECYMDMTYVTDQVF